MGGLRDHRWEVSYSTSDLREDGSPVNILHDFYIPALSHSTHYDRVAGYFSSSSLAAASQGFTRFVENGGGARFIVGVDLAPEDASAILAGDEARAAERLDEFLGSELNWSEAVRNGVQLLAWMVAHGYLTVKVAIRVHGESGDPCSLEYRGDGYVHEKWALFQDAEGDGLVATGSLNESRTALEINAENLEVAQTWVGRGQESFDKKARNFEAMWQGRHPWIRTFDLPDAVQRRLVDLAGAQWRLKEIDGTLGPSLKRVQEKPTLQERARFALIRLGPLLPGGEHVGVETAPITPWPHQRFVTRRVMDSYPQNHLLCDEVGLGKTIEAGLVFRGLWLAGRATSIRVFAPASLTSQWLHEMAEKFFLPFRRRLGRHGNAEVVQPESGQTAREDGALFDSPLEIVSTGLLSRGDQGRLLQDMPETDLVLVDEAHKARRKDPDATNHPPRYNHLYQALERGLYPRARSLLLATATPMQINRVEAFDLLRFMPTGGAVRFAPDLSNLFYALRERLLGGEDLTDHEQAWLARYLRNARDTAPEQWAFVQDWALDLLGRGDLEGLVDHDAEPMDWTNLQPALTMLAPVGRAMLRHTRGLLREYQRDGRLEANLAERQVYPDAVPFPAQERQVYEALQEYCRELAQRISANMEESQQRAAIGFYLSFLRQRFSSSVFALQQSLQRRIEKIRRTLEHQEAQAITLGDAEELDELAEQEKEGLVLKNRKPADLSWEEGEVRRMLASLSQLSEIPGKTKRLLQIIEGRRRGGGSRVKQIVVFTRYGDTLDHLYDLIGRRLPDCPLGTFSGQGGRVRWAGRSQGEGHDRTTIKRLFLSQEIDILLCTDAAAEGLNLQSADLMVNFDLPWNPMLLEQRIGRIDRIGQQHGQVHVLNMMYQGTVEEVVYVRLVQRFMGAREVTGELPFSLLPLDEKDFRDFAKTVGEDEKIDEQGLIERAQEKQERLEQRREVAEISAAQQKAAYEALEEQKQGPRAPVDLTTIWQALTSSPFLQEQGCDTESFPHGEAFRLQGIPGLEETVLLTTDVALYEHGLPTGDGRRLAFATYGDPVFEHLLNHLLADNPSVKAAWDERRPLKGLRTPQGGLVRHAQELGKLAETGQGELEVIAEEGRAAPRKSGEPTAALQKRLLNLAAAALAEEKLGDQPDSVNNQLHNLERFRRSKERESTSAFRKPIPVQNRAELLAHKEELLWPVLQQGDDLAVQGDPLLIRAVSGVVERQLNDMRKENRTGAGVASRLRQNADSGVLA